MSSHTRYYQQGDVVGGYTLINDGDLPRVPLHLQPRRSDGIHLSNILSVIHGYSKTITPETDESRREFQSRSTNLMELGLIFEEGGLKTRLDRVYPGRYLLDPPSLIRDGINMTPDLYDIERDTYPDIKLTRKSATASPGGRRFAYWEEQVKGYCYADDCNTGQIMVCHVMGYYEPGNQWDGINDVVFHIWERRYEEEELVANWSKIRAVNERRRR